MNVTSRPYAGEADFARLQAFLAHARMAVSETHYLHIGDLTWQLFHMLADFDPSQLVRIWEHEQRELVGFVLLHPRFGGFDLQLDPAWRDQLLELEMLNWAEAQLQQRWPRDHRDMSTLVNQGDILLQGLLTSRGFAPNGDWLYMQRSLAGPLPVVEPPPGWSVRNVQSFDEAAARATVIGLAFEAPPFVDWYRKLMRSPGYDMDLDLVAVAPDGHFGAFAQVWVDPANKVGQFEPVGTAPDARRLGLARTLLSEGLRRMQSRGMETAIVIVEAAEQAACRLYTSVGFETAWHLDWSQQRDRR
jgi:ribosomal protein S18 acetylase RimI-like enzyme